MLFCVKSIPERENMRGISRKCPPPRSAPPAAFSLLFRKICGHCQQSITLCIIIPGTYPLRK
nr:MAG TPA: hypothetical protein [Inoviridae sp.]